jgi:hypothetical protein
MVFVASGIEQTRINRPVLLKDDKVFMNDQCDIIESHSHNIKYVTY